MARQRITGTQLAERLGRSQPYVSRRLVGEVPFDLGDLEAIAAELGVPLTKFLAQAA